MTRRVRKSQLWRVFCSKTIFEATAVGSTPPGVPRSITSRSIRSRNTVLRHVVLRKIVHNIVPLGIQATRRIRPASAETA